MIPLEDDSWDWAVEELNGDNWHTWKGGMMGLLIYHDVWSHVTGSRPRPVLDESTPAAFERLSREIEQWESGDAAAQMRIMRHLDDSEIFRVTQVEGAQTAKEMWDALKREHVERNASSKAFKVFEEMLNRRYVEGTSASEYTGHFRMDRRMLEDYKVEVSEEVLAMLILASIPRESDILKNVLHQSLSHWNETGRISLDDVENSLGRAEVIYNFFGEKQPDNSTVKSRIWCTFHRKKSHNTDDCRALARLRRG